MSAGLAVAAVPGIRITEIVVGDRARKDYGDLTPLMESIRDVGLLQPVGVLPGNRLLFGGRRLEACRRLGWESITFVRPATRDDALSLLKAERDENTCRKDMTLSELVEQGSRIEELEGPASDARKAEGQRLGAEVRWGSDAWCSAEHQASDKSANTTRHKVGDALGLSGSTYARAKKVIDTAEDEALSDEVRAVARDAVKEMDKTGKVSGAYGRVQAALKPEAADRTPAKRPPVKPKRPEMLRGTPHIDSRRVIAATVDGYANGHVPTDMLAEVNFGELETRDLEEWISSLSESISALRSLQTTLKKELNHRA